MTSTLQVQLRPVPKPRQKVSNLVKHDESPGCSGLQSASPPAVPPKPPGLMYAGVKFREGVQVQENWTQHVDETEKKMESEEETDDQRKAAAARIVHNLQDGVGALADVLEGYKDRRTSAESATEIVHVRMRPTAPLESEVYDDEVEEAAVITESQITAVFEKAADSGASFLKLKDAETVMKASTASSIDYIDNDDSIWLVRKVDDVERNKDDEQETTLSGRGCPESKQSLPTFCAPHLKAADTGHPVEREPCQLIVGTSESPPEAADSSPKNSEPEEGQGQVVVEREKSDKGLSVVIPGLDGSFTDSESDNPVSDPDQVPTSSRLDDTEDSQEGSDRDSNMEYYNNQYQPSNHRRTLAVAPSKPQPAARKKLLLRVEDVVPQEYNSSPIVQILAAKGDQERPRPPKTLDDLNRSLAAMSSASSLFPQSRTANNLSTNAMTASLFTGVSPGSSSGSSGISSDLRSTPRVHEIRIRQSKQPSNLYLPRMGVSSSVPLHHSSSTSSISLLEMIIRTHPIWYLPHLGRAASNHFLRTMPCGCFIVRASTRPSSMALSIRLPPGMSSETDHYLIERHGSTVKLEGSPHVFRSLPLLMEHYCRVSTELQCKLTLPPAIQMCSGTIDLQRVALMGQDFWTSELARVQPYRRQISQPIMSTTGISEESKRAAQKRISPSYSSALSDQLNGNTIVRPETKPRRNLQTKTEMLLKKSQSENNHVQHARESSNTSGNSSVSSKSAKSQKQHFLRNLFSSSSNSIQPASSTSNVQETASSNSKFYLNGSATTSQGYVSNQELFQKGASTSDVTTSSSLKRGFAKFASFKSKPKSTKDDASCSNLSAEAIKARQEAFRREKTDLSGLSVQRLASHRNVNHSPTRKMFQKPVLVPANRDAEAMKVCIEELRAKRLNQTAKSSENQMLREESTRNPTMSRKDPAAILKEFGGFIQNNGKPYEVIMRNKKAAVLKRSSKFNERLSVPNFNDDTSEDEDDDMSDYRFGRIADTGELDTINEGLITPVVRRKTYNGKKIVGQSQLVSAVKDNYTKDEYVESNLKLKQDVEKQSKQAPQVPHKPSSLSSGQTSSKPAAPAGRSLYSVVSPGKNNNHLLQNSWSQINSELKLKQKVAKVRPTPQPSMASTVSSASAEASKRHSEYAHLSELSAVYDADNSIGSFHSTNSNPVDDDDAVSVAGTVFNEPWDSNAWESLLDIAKYGDEKPNVRSVANTFYLNSSATIEEETSPAPLEIDDVVISCVESDSDDLLNSPQSDDVCVVEEPVNESEDLLTSLNEPNKLSIDNRIWTEVSQRIPSEPGSKTSTYDPRKQTSNSLMNMSNTSSLSRGRLAQHNQLFDYTPVRSQSRQKSADPGARIQNYVEKIAKDTDTVFGATLRRFIECTIEAEECDPYVVIRNVRQFLNGIKNYLVKHGEGDLHSMIEVESGNLSSNEFLNIDAILEAVLHKILLVPIKNHLYHLMVKEHSRNGSLQLLSENLMKVRTTKPEDLGFPRNAQMPSVKDMENIKTYLRKMQDHYSPLKKLENLLKALDVVVGIVNNSENNNSPKKSLSMFHQNSNFNIYGMKKLPPADELIRWIVYILAKTSTINCEIEAWYMWELLPQQLLTTGDAAYYLTTLFSAVHVLKNPDSIKRLGKCLFVDSDSGRSNSDKACDAFISIAIPDEQAGSIEYHTFPAVSQMNASKLCRVIAHQFAITNPEDYGLYILFDGFETCLLPTECPDAIRDQLLEAGKPHLFAYKRHEAKIAWPKNVISSSAPSSSSNNSSPKSNPESQPAFQLRPQHPVQPSPIHKRKQLPVASKII